MADDLPPELPLTSSADPPMRSGAPSWWESPLLVALLCSLFLHVAMFFVAALVMFARPAPAELGGGESATFDLAADQDRSLTELPAASLAASASALKPIASEQTFDLSDPASPFSEISSLDQPLEGLDELGGAGDAGAMGAGDEGLGGAGSGEARFFGVEARGSRFAFIVDVSGSMLEPGKIGALKSALLESVEGMLEQASFCVVLYSSEAVPLMGEKWTRATEDNKAQARRNIVQITARGPTHPLGAFNVVLALRPEPDAIYFMTDGVFSPEDEAAIPTLIERAVREAERKTPIHCITFVDRGSEKLMRRLARQSGGSYTHIEGPRR